MRSDPILRSALAISAATGAYGLSYGVLAVGAGLSVAQASAMSLLVFTGASQFAVVGVLGAGGSVAAAAAPALLLAARNAIYGLSLASILRGGHAARAWQSQLVIDESTAMARAHPHPRDARRAFLATGLSVFACWNLGSLAGALLGGSVGDPRVARPRRDVPGRLPGAPGAAARRPEARTAALCGAVIALLLVPLTPVGVPVLAAVLGLVPPSRACERSGRSRRELDGASSRSRRPPTRSRRSGRSRSAPAPCRRASTRSSRCSPSRCWPRSCSCRPSTRPAG